MEFDIRKFDCMNMFDDEAFTRKCMPEGKLFNSQTAGRFHGQKMNFPVNNPPI